MEFITVEQFKEQPKEVQKVFLDWWKPSNGDLFTTIDEYSEFEESDLLCIQDYDEASETWSSGYSWGYSQEESIPLFTEGQLRKFIEDKLDMKIQCEIHPLTLDYIILVKNNSGNKVWMHTGKEDLLQAYWKVACMIAKEG